MELSNVKALMQDIGTRLIGGRIIYHQQTASTNQDALDLARMDQEEGTVIIADHQLAGRGRLNRPWESAPSKDIALSVLLYPDLPSDSFSLLPILAGIAACETLRDSAEVFALLKWPNDVIIDDRKICGILVEARMLPGGRRAVALGLGLNVNSEESDFSDEVRQKATSLKMATGQTFDRKLIALALLRRLEYWYDRFLEQGHQPIIVRWSELSGTLGHRVTVMTGAETIRGKAKRLGWDGSLIVRTEDGDQRITVGDVVQVVRKA